MTDVDDKHHELLPLEEIENPVAANPVGVAILQLTLERLTLKGIACKIIQGLGDSLVERGFPLCHTADDALGVIGKFNLIDGQERL